MRLKLRNQLVGLLAFVGSLLYWGCEENSLPEPRDGAPIVVLSAELDGMSFSHSAGLDSVVAETEVVDNQDLRLWKFSMIDQRQRHFGRIDLYIRNHQVPFEDPFPDLQQTVEMDSFNYAFLLPPIDADPFQTKRVEVVLTTIGGVVYESILLPQQQSFFNIESTQSLVREGRQYLLTGLQFDCQLVNADSLDTLRLRSLQANLLFGGI
ncbi:MAG: hypothetical protein ACFB10_00740 [Salibacteraceae bacterium]